MRRAQRSFGDGLIAEEVEDLREGWMDHADSLLDDESRGGLRSARPTPPEKLEPRSAW
jgi:hypothetical protein